MTQSRADQALTLVQRVTPVLIGILIVMTVALLPDPSGIPDRGRPVEAFHGVIESVSPPTDGEESPVYRAQVRLLEGPEEGSVLEALVLGAGGSAIAATYLPGDEVVVTIAEMSDGQEPLVSVSDRWRLPTLSGLVLLFVAAVVAVGGWHGLRALVALALTIAVILKILLPLVITGVPPIPLAVVAASAISVISIVMTEGIRRTSLAAILGTTCALAVTGLLAAAATWLLGFTYLAGSDLAFLATSDGQGLDLRGILLAAIILGAVGVLDDVTVTQAVLVQQLGETGDVEVRELGIRAMRVGRSHIAATVNTL